MKEIGALITGILSLLNTSADGQKRRNIKLAKRIYKKLKKEFKKGGFDEEELKMLDDLEKSITKKIIEL